MNETLAFKEFIRHLLVRVELNIRDRLHMLLIFTVQRQLELIFYHLVLLLFLRNPFELLDHLMQVFQLHLNILLVCCSPILDFPALLRVLAHAE